MSEIRPAASTDFLRVTEIFHSIQGESTWAGLPCTFVRLTGCPLRCTWCDTGYAFHGGQKMALDEIIDAVGAAGSRIVEITGGEPLIHPNAFVLCAQLLDRGYTVLVETSGAIDVSRVDPRAHRIMDLKCPGSGESARTSAWTGALQRAPCARSSSRLSGVTSSSATSRPGSSPTTCRSASSSSFTSSSGAQTFREYEKKRPPDRSGGHLHFLSESVRRQYSPCAAVTSIQFRPAIGNASANRSFSVCARSTAQLEY